MHLKKTKKTPRMFRMIALMLSLVLVFFTMTGMALAEEGTDVSDAALYPTGAHGYACAGARL